MYWKYKFDLFFSRIRNMYFTGKLKISIKSYDHDSNNFRINSSINARKDRLTEIIYSKTRQMFELDETIQLSEN